jgi:hypothetical protein
MGGLTFMPFKRAKMVNTQATQQVVLLISVARPSSFSIYNLLSTGGSQGGGTEGSRAVCLNHIILSHWEVN